LGRIKYRLFSVILHKGSELKGHYVVLHLPDGQGNYWLPFDDALINLQLSTPTMTAQLIKHGYIALYKVIGGG